MGTIRFLRLAFFAVSEVAGRRLDGEGSILGSAILLHGQVSVAIVEVQRRTWIGEYGGRVAPVEHEVEEDAEKG